LRLYFEQIADSLGRPDNRARTVLADRDSLDSALAPYL
jgi:hypothetical protein